MKKTPRLPKLHALPSIMDLLNYDERQVVHYYRPSLESGITVLRGQEADTTPSTALGICRLILPRNFITPVHRNLKRWKHYFHEKGVIMVILVIGGRQKRVFLTHSSRHIEIRPNTPHAICGMDPRGEAVDNQLLVITSSREPDAEWEPKTDELIQKQPRQ